jgi:hypothetical protein
MSDITLDERKGSVIVREGKGYKAARDPVECQSEESIT